MSTFITPVSIAGTQEQLRSLIPKLKQLGYIDKAFSIFVAQCLATNYDGGHDGFATLGSALAKQHERYFINPFNEELFLALAAMREGSEVHLGEYIIRTGISSVLIIGKMYKVTNGVDQDNISVESDPKSYMAKFFRKATKEEIIAHFTPVIPTKEAEPKFTLPQKWYVVRNAENAKVVNAWYNSTNGYGRAWATSIGYFFPDKIYEDSCNHNITGYTEITFEQFKEHILNQLPMKEKKILGYKVPFDIKICDQPWREDETAVKNVYQSKELGNYCVAGMRRVLPADIVEKWEPVYESEEKILTLANNVKVKITKDSVDIDDIRLTKTEITNIYNSMQCFTS